MIPHRKEKFDNGEIACTVELVLAVMGGKWKPIILWHLGEREVLRYGELKRIIRKITPKVLIQQLRELEEDGIVIRKEYHQIPPKVEYSLSDTGKELIPMLKMLCDWGERRILGAETVAEGLECRMRASAEL